MFTCASPKNVGVIVVHLAAFFLNHLFAPLQECYYNKCKLLSALFVSMMLLMLRSSLVYCSPLLDVTFFFIFMRVHFFRSSHPVFDFFAIPLCFSIAPLT